MPYYIIVKSPANLFTGLYIFLRGERGSIRTPGGDFGM